ncbi:MAG: FxLYD domain-containing protein [Armatimonadia bacterium]
MTAHYRCLLVALTVLVLVLLPGCRGRSAGDVSQLLISDQRQNIDDDRGEVLVYGRLENTGAGHFSRVEIHATLWSRGGDKAGENSVFVENVQPKEKRDFALKVTAHARVSDVDLEVRIPEGP